VIQADASRIESIACGRLRLDAPNHEDRMPRQRQEGVPGFEDDREAERAAVEDVRARQISHAKGEMVNAGGL
jgi:hypothetical protein